MNRLVTWVAPRTWPGVVGKSAALLVVINVVNWAYIALVIQDPPYHWRDVPNCTLVALPFVAFLMTVLRHLHQLQTDYARLAREFEALATTDMLTGLPNRRAFMDRLERTREDGRPGALLLLDADHFKRINDT